MAAACFFAFCAANLILVHSAFLLQCISPEMELRDSGSWSVTGVERTLQGRHHRLGPTAEPQSSTWLTMPSANFGSNQVDFGGMMPPASATAIRSSMLVG